MRLLQFQENESLGLTRELINYVPEYAILSHTWSDDGQEVTFQDIQHHVGQHKAGYRKLKFCSKQATANGLRYFWIDTCCIDTSNNTELSEAIYIMFRWYRNSTKRCDSRPWGDWSRLVNRGAYNRFI